MREETGTEVGGQQELFESHPPEGGCAEDDVGSLDDQLAVEPAAQFPSVASPGRGRLYVRVAARFVSNRNGKGVVA